MIDLNDRTLFINAHEQMKTRTTANNPSNEETFVITFSHQDFLSVLLCVPTFTVLFAFNLLLSFLFTTRTLHVNFIA